jgi:hypothetical protein
VGEVSPSLQPAQILQTIRLAGFEPASATPSPRGFAPKTPSLSSAIIHSPKGRSPCNAPGINHGGIENDRGKIPPFSIPYYPYKRKITGQKRFDMVCCSVERNTMQEITLEQALEEGKGLRACSISSQQ